MPTPDDYSGRYVYVVHSVEIVTPDSMWVVSQDYRHAATLFACHPPGSVSERIVVFLDLVDPETLALVDPPRADDDDIDGRIGLTTPWRALVALAGGLLVALALPPWGWWPLAFIGIAVFELAVGERPSPAALPARVRLRLRLARHRDGVDVAADGARVSRRHDGLHALPRRRRAGDAGWSVEHDRSTIRPHMAEALRFVWPFGGVPLASLGIAEATAPIAGVVRVGGVVLLTWVVFQVGIALGALIRRLRDPTAEVRLPAAGLFAAAAVVVLGLVAPRVAGPASSSTSPPSRGAASRARAPTTCRARSSPNVTSRRHVRSILTASSISCCGRKTSSTCTSSPAAPSSKRWPARRRASACRSPSASPRTFPASRTASPTPR